MDGVLSSGGVARRREKFESIAGRLEQESVEIRSDTFQAYDPGGERFDVILMIAAVNHLNEEACMACIATAGPAMRTVSCSPS